MKNSVATMSIEERLSAFVKLGEVMRDVTGPGESRYAEKYRIARERAFHENGWFSPRFIDEAVAAWGALLTREKLEKWVAPYSGSDREREFTVGLILAGNIPMVGFHDILSTLTAGCKVSGKLSSKDSVLLPFFTDMLIEIAPQFSERIELGDERWSEVDAVIATGSDNSARYFEYYFGKYPRIIRKNRSSAAVLSGDETDEELSALGADIFTYYGLGCRNVSKIYFPEGFDTDRFFKAMADWSFVSENNKYMNNYEYNRAVFLLNEEPGLLDNNFMLLKRDDSLHSPTGVVHAEFYRDADEPVNALNDRREEVQCIVSRGDIPFGRSQTPELWDYADGKDTLAFLTSI